MVRLTIAMIIRRMFLFIMYLSVIQTCHGFATMSKFQANGGIIYKRNVLSSKEMNAIMNEIKQVKFINERSSIANLRQGAVLSKHGDAFRILNDPEGSFSQVVRKVINNNSNSLSKCYGLCSVVPLEVRKYENIGSAMAWHIDDILFDPPQIEVILTVENESIGCKTMWKEQRIDDPTYEKVVEEETEPNSAIFLLAGGVEHCVSALKGGKRVILKFALVAKESMMLDDASDVLGQFSNSRKNTNKKSSKNSKRSCKN